jgi:hypothetical protein
MTEPMISWWLPPMPPRAPDRPIKLADVWDDLFGKRETFCRVELDGSWLICEWREARDIVGDFEDGDQYKVTPVRMTRRQYEALPEFEGF